MYQLRVITQAVCDISCRRLVRVAVDKNILIYQSLTIDPWFLELETIQHHQDCILPIRPKRNDCISI